MTRRFKTIILIFFFSLAVLLFVNLRPLQYTIKQNSHPEGVTEEKTNQNASSSDNTNATNVYKIMIDPGHGGKDSGAEKGHVVESKVTLDISKKLKSCLEDKSYEVELTRVSDTSLYMLSNIEGTMQKKELDARTNIINNSKAKIFISIHVNSYPEYPNMSGSIVYFNPSIPESRKLANFIQEQLNGISIINIKRDSHNSQEADFYMLKNSTIPGVLVETGFITNKSDRRLLTLDSFKSQIAKAITDGIENYIQSKKSPLP